MEISTVITVNNIEVSQNIKNINLIWSCNAVPGHTFVNEINDFNQVICRAPEFCETLFVITVRWDQPKCSSMDKCIRNSTHTNART